MTDYYMAEVDTDRIVEWGKWNGKLRGLAVGESFTVDTGSDRDSALQSARRVGVIIKTRKLISGGYCIERINACAPRKRGHPKKDQYEN